MNKLNLKCCDICGEEKTSRGFSQHIKRSHNISLNEYIIKYIFNDKHPTCKCGCGIPVTIRGYFIMDYVDGHCSSGHFKKGETPKRNKDIWLKNLTKGIQEYNNKSKKENPNYRSGKNNNFYQKRHTQETKNKIKSSVEKQIANGNHAFIGNLNGRVGKSSLEKKFETFLIKMKIPYIHNYTISYFSNNKSYNNYKYYDFYIKKTNQLIELHGTYWHPRELTENLSELQISNYYNDLFKKDLAFKNGYSLDTIYDIELDNYIDNFYKKYIENLIVEI